MGLSFGGSSQKSQSSGNSSPTYSADQSSLQAGLLSAFQSILPGLKNGQIGPQVQAVQTQNADTINKSYNGLGDRMTKFLAARGFGQSGESGKTQLQTELGRQGALATNDSNAAGLQLQQNQNWLSDALGAAFMNPGSTGSQSGSGSASNWGASGALSFGF